MTWNFFLNNLITYRDRRLRGLALVRGLAVFYAIGAIGFLANVGVASMLFQERHIWWLAGIAGALMGLAWNFTLSSLFTWGSRPASRGARRPVRATSPGSRAGCW